MWNKFACALKFACFPISLYVAREWELGKIAWKKDWSIERDQGLDDFVSLFCFFLALPVYFFSGDWPNAAQKRKMRANGVG